MPKNTIILTGGGTAGHITPVLAVAQRIHRLQPETKLVYIVERKNINEQLISDSRLPISVHHIFAGKYRRFHNQTLLTKVISFKSNLLNARDFFYIIIGMLQSIGLILRYRPKVLFSKGGYVSVPVSISAVLLHVPFITHDSDSVPGIANRIVGRWAKTNAVGYKDANYPYDSKKTVFTGTPVTEEYHMASAQSSSVAKTAIGLPQDSLVVLIGGSTQGAKRIDDAVESIVPELLDKFPKLVVIHSFGRLNEDSLKTRYRSLSESLRHRLILKSFIPDFYRYAAAADIVITRAGATALAELGVLGKACIVIPAEHLVEGHQLENCKSLVRQAAIEEVHENEVGELLLKRVEYLLQHKEARGNLGKKLKSITPADAAECLAGLILNEE